MTDRDPKVPPRPPRPSDHEFNQRISQHSYESVNTRVQTLERGYADLVTGLQARDKAIGQQLLEQDVAAVVIARAVGADLKCLPEGLVGRSMPPPGAELAEKPAQAQRRALPKPSVALVLAFVFAIAEAIKGVADIVRHLHGAP